MGIIGQPGHVGRIFLVQLGRFDEPGWLPVLELKKQRWEEKLR